MKVWVVYTKGDKDFLAAYDTKEAAKRAADALKGTGNISYRAMEAHTLQSMYAPTHRQDNDIPPDELGLG